MKYACTAFLTLLTLASPAAAEDKTPSAARGENTVSTAAGDKAAPSFEGYSKFVRDNVHIDLNPDATYTETIDYAIKVLDKNAIDGLNKQYMSYSNSLTDMEVIDAYTLKSDGKKIPVPKDNFQVETNTGDKGAAPIISDITTKTVVFPDVEAGDTIVFTYKLIQKEALFPHQFSYAKIYSDTYIYDEAEFSVSAPESLPIRVDARGVKGGEEARGADGKRHWVWHYENHDRGKPSQQELVSSFDYGPRVLVTTFKDYAELAQAYGSRAEPKAAVTDRIRKLADDIVKDAKDPRTVSRLLYEWVAHNIRYAGNCIGIGSVVPHDTDHILDNKIGDCKDHTALLEALLRAKGIESSPALVNSGSIYSLPDLPVAELFNHVINYIPSLNLYADSTSETTPFGSLPMQEEGKYTLHTKDFAGAKQTPPTDNSKQWGKTHADITFGADGSADGTITVIRAGHFAEGIDRIFERIAIDPRMREDVLRQMVVGSGYKGTADFVRYGKDARDADVFSYTLRFHAENALNLPGPGASYISPLLRGQDIAIADFLGPAMRDLPKHEFPCTGASSTIEVVFHLPKSVKVLAVPRGAHLKWQYGSYDATYTQRKNVITAVRKIVDTTPGNVCKPEMDEMERNFAVAVYKELKSQLIYN